MSTTARDVMKTEFRTLGPEAPITEAVDIFLEANADENRRVFGLMVTDNDGRLVGMLSMNRFGAVLVVDSGFNPAGVLSKSDSILAYNHHIDPETAAEKVMSYPVRTCGEDQLLEDAILQMILADVQRLFIHRDTRNQVVGVLSLSDAARIRSGSCHACGSSRITVETDA